MEVEFIKLTARVPPFIDKKTGSLMYWLLNLPEIPNPPEFPILTDPPLMVKFSSAAFPTTNDPLFILNTPFTHTLLLHVIRQNGEFKFNAEL